MVPKIEFLAFAQEIQKASADIRDDRPKRVNYPPLRRSSLLFTSRTYYRVKFTTIHAPALF